MTKINFIIPINHPLAFLAPIFLPLIKTLSMQAYDNAAQAHPDDAPSPADEYFFPKGAIAFFAILVLLGLIIWFGIYFLMLSRI